MSNLTQGERDQLAQQLLAEQASLNAKLAQLGITPQPKSPEKSPDGGPPSFAHVELAKHSRIRRLIPVTHEVNGEKVETLIAEEHFDPAVHTRVGGGRKRATILDGAEPSNTPAPNADRKKIDPGKFGKQDRSELLTLTVPVLSAMPEVRVMEEVPTDKSKLVEAILAVRGDYQK